MLNLIALTLAASTASADDIGRSLTGERIEHTAASVLVFWSLDCGTCGERMAELEEAGVPVIAVNTDAASQAAGLRTFARRHGISAPILADSSGDLQRRFQMTDGAVVLDRDGEAVWRLVGAEVAMDALLSEGASATIVAQ